MRVVIQRVTEAQVIIDTIVNGQIQNGLLILLAIEEVDTINDINYLVKKITQLRIFADENDKMNLSIKDTNGDVLLISQFTLFADTKKGNRPNFLRSAKPNVAIPLYEKFIEILEIELHKKIQTGVFGANMQVQLINDGPVTILIDSKIAM